MNPRFETFRTRTALGRQIEAIARDPQHVYGYRLLTRLGMPAVVALSWDLAPILAPLSPRERDEAKQFCGAVVGDIMRAEGFEVVNPRGSARVGGVFTHGAVWGGQDTISSVHDRGLAIAEQAMDRYGDALAELAK